MSLCEDEGDARSSIVKTCVSEFTHLNLKRYDILMIKNDCKAFSRGTHVTYKKKIGKVS